MCLVKMTFSLLFTGVNLQLRSSVVVGKNLSKMFMTITRVQIWKAYSSSLTTTLWQCEVFIGSQILLNLKISGQRNGCKILEMSNFIFHVQCIGHDVGI